MRKITKWVLGAAAVVAVALTGGLTAMQLLMTPPDDLDLAREKRSETGLYTVGMAPEREPLRQGELHSWIATIATAEGAPVADATIAVDGGMPQHGHGLPTAPQAGVHLGEGRYRIDGMRFNMSGWWEIELDISSPAGVDSVTFNLVM